MAKLLFVLAAPLVCGMFFVALFSTFVGLTIPQLPVWAQQSSIEWMFDIPQDNYDLSGQTGWAGQAGQPYAGGQIAHTGYQGAQSFLCILPGEYGYVSDHYGVVRPAGYLHSGIDYGTYYQPVAVRTPLGGRVTYAGWSAVGYGWLLVIENAGWQIYLGHNTEMYVAQDDTISAGDVVALSGSSGNSSAHHIHFEVRMWDGEYWLPRNPNSVSLPGQTGECDWDSLENEAPAQP